MAEEQEKSELERKVIEVLRTCYDPEIPLNIYDLGLIYGLKVDEGAGAVEVQMTLTAPSCPVAGSLPGQVQMRIEGIPGVKQAKVELVWDPPWEQSRLSQAALIQLGLY